jgi:hypothetical protein
MLRILLQFFYKSLYLYLLCFCASLSATPYHQSHTVDSGDSAAIRILARGASIRFIENKGQYPENVLFIAPINDGRLIFMRDRIMLQQTEEYSSTIATDSLQANTHSLMSELRVGGQERLSKHDSRSATKILLNFDTLAWGSPTAQGLRTERANYFYTKSSRQDATIHIPTYDTLIYSNLQDGVDLHFFRSNTTLSYKLTSRDSEDISQSALYIDLDKQMKTLCPESSIPDPVSVQPGILTSDRIVYSTLLGGGKSDGIYSILPARKNVYYLVGSTKSPDFPISVEAWDRIYKGDTNTIYSMMVFVSCLDIENNELIFSTYFGGSDLDGALAAALDSDGNIVFAGSTWSDDLPTTDNAFQKTYRGEGDGYVAAIDSTGAELVFCSYIGGTDVENLWDMKIDAEGNIVLTGITMSRNFPTTPGVVQPRYGGGEDDMFVAKLNSDASQLLFGTYFGGNGYDEGYSLRLTDSGDILVAGYTNSDNFPVTPDALYSRRAAFDEGCVFILSPDGSRIIYSTYIGWNAYENARHAYLDSDGVMTVFGITTSDDLPVTEKAFQQRKGEYPAYNPYLMDFYILKFHVATAKILACTYLGGSERERYPWVFFPMWDGRVLIGGDGYSNDYPVTDSITSSSSSILSPQISIVNDDLSELIFSIRYACSDVAGVNYASIYDGSIYLAGYTTAADFPVTSTAYQKDLKGRANAYFMILELSDILTDVRESPHAVPFAILHPNYPNPARNGATIPYSLSQPGHVRLSIHDMLGRALLTLTDERKQAGYHQASLSPGMLRPGAYIIRLLTGEGQRSRLMQVIEE